MTPEHENGRTDEELRKPLEGHENRIVRTGLIPEHQRRLAVREFMKKTLLYAGSATAALLAVKNLFGEALSRFFGGPTP